MEKNGKKKNRLKENILQQCKKENMGKKPRERKVKPMEKLRKLSKDLKVSFWTALRWYRNKGNPQGQNEVMLPEYYDKRMEEFYYYEY